MFDILLQSSGWTLFVGRFHPVLVHLPIGFLLIAALLEIGRRAGKIPVSVSVINFILFWSAVGASVACVAGYFLSLGGGYDAALLESHKWQGVGVAVFAWVAWMVSSGWFNKKMPRISVLYLPAFGLSTLLTLTAGHDGGSLTHGEGYLTQNMPGPLRNLAGIPPAEVLSTDIKPIGNIEQAVVYEDIVKPMMKQSCVQCHNESKKKGDLRLDEFAFMMKGGEGGPALVAGKSTESDLVKRCLLPENDDDHMPPKGKPQLTSEQITLLSWWIDQGAPVDKKVSDLKVSDQVKPALASLKSTAKGTGSGIGGRSESLIAKLAVSVPDQKSIEALRKAGLTVNKLSQDQNLLEVSAVNAPGFGDAQISLLLPLSEQITWLKLGGTKISDQSLKEIARLKNLNKLHLEHTAVTDAGIADLKSLSYLQYVNLFDTKISDSGLKNIAGMKSLRSVYVWQSGVTDSVVSQVAKQYPNLSIVHGLSASAMARFIKSDDTTAAGIVAK
ncbi:c-type cytochrome domain-containing protein [Dyadobacter sp. LHD-138]|uniref:c-type cytochrome domain-containing protein n=1 Tax=Dyadobacter sp. LHD-138 TaxID=3071413 RepID=UPI0027E04E9E|nr:c-type cytochrome domain-containing protein [Dyadobacter sp. LHD-138]MDQ6477071.1 c-type cytochrome domain-containing protein [Dyadobacter sp. LHD-138]